MVRAVSSKDFRSRRYILEKKDYGYAPDGRSPKPKDLISKRLWRSLTVLPDTVAIHTSSHAGGILQHLYDINLVWLKIIERYHEIYKNSKTKKNKKLNNILFTATISAYDELEASIFNMLNGYYKEAFSIMRSYVENILISLLFKIDNDVENYCKWQDGSLLKPMKYNELCKKLIGIEKIKNLERFLKDKQLGSFFNPATRDDSGGRLKKLYSKLCKYTHSEPGYTNFDLWKSTGPIFSSEAFFTFVDFYQELFLCGLILIKIADQSLIVTESFDMVYTELNDDIEITHTLFRHLLGD